MDPNELPKTLKVVMLFIDRVGFPVLAFILMFYMAFISIGKLTVALTDNTKALSVFANNSDVTFKTILSNQICIMTDIKQLMMSVNRGG